MKQQNNGRQITTARLQAPPCLQTSKKIMAGLYICLYSVHPGTVAIYSVTVKLYKDNNLKDE